MYNKELMKRVVIALMGGVLVTAVGSRVLVAAQENEPASGVIEAAEIDELTDDVPEEPESVAAEVEEALGQEDPAVDESLEVPEVEDETPIILQSVEAEIYKLDEENKVDADGNRLYVLDEETEDSVVLEGYMPEGAIARVYPAETDFDEGLEVVGYEIRVFEADGLTAFLPESDRDIVVYIKSGEVLGAIDAGADVAFWRMDDEDVAPRIGQFSRTIDDEIGLESYSPWVAFAWELPEEPEEVENPEGEAVPQAGEAEAGVLEVPEESMLTDDSQGTPAEPEAGASAEPEAGTSEETSADQKPEEEANEEPIRSIVDSATEEQAQARAEAKTVSAASAALAAITTIDEPEDEQAAADETAAEDEAQPESVAEAVAALRSQQVIEAELYVDADFAQPYEAEGVSVTLEGLLSAGSVVKAYPVMSGIEGEKTYAAYSITIFDADGNVFSPEDGEFITVTFDDPEIRKAAEERKKLHGWHQDKESGEYSDLDFLILADGRVRFITDSF